MLDGLVNSNNQREFELGDINPKSRKPNLKRNNKDVRAKAAG